MNRLCLGHKPVICICTADVLVTCWQTDQAEHLPQRGTTCRRFLLPVDAYALNGLASRVARSSKHCISREFAPNDIHPIIARRLRELSRIRCTPNCFIPSCGSRHLWRNMHEHARFIWSPNQSKQMSQLNMVRTDVSKPKT